MRTLRERALLSAVSISLFALGCGGAQSSGTDNGGSSIEIPESEWARAPMPEGGLSMDLPGTPVRQISSTEDSRTVQYVLVREPLAVVVGIEQAGGVVTPSQETAALDRVGEFLVGRSREPQRGCTPGPLETITHQGRSGRAFVANACAGIHDGSMAAAVFLHGSAVVTFVVVGDGVSQETTGPLMARVGESIQFADAPSWFLPVTTQVTPPNLPGLSLAMPGAPALEVVEETTGVTARFVSEPILGLGALALVTVPAALPLAQYCNAVMASELLTMTERRGDVVPGSNLAYCEVRGRRVADPETLEIHDLVVVSGAVIELIWVGPTAPSFVAGGEAQLRDMRASIRVP